MPAYINSPFKPAPKLLVAGWPEYLIGSFNFDVAWGKFAVTNFALTSDVATLTGVIIAGNIPAVGDFISTQGTPFDVTDATITGVTINADTGVGTITYAASNADIDSVGSGGTAEILPAEASEAISSNYTSIPVSVPFQDTKAGGERTITVVVSTPTNSSLLATFTLQGALRDVDSDYTALSPNGTAITAVSLPTSAGGAVSAEYCLTQYRFFRLLLTFTSGSGTAVAKIEA